jgi:hypothetical protein
MAGRVDTPLPPGVTPPDGDPVPVEESARGASAMREVREQLREILTLFERNDRNRA